jgi:nitrite reductase (NADH) small subunit
MGTASAAAPGPGVDAAPQWQGVCPADAVPLLGARRIERAGFDPVAVFRTHDGQVFALVDRCPHKGGPLSQGIVFGHSVACPLHNWTISLQDGCAAAPDSGCTPAIPVRVIEGVVQLDLARLPRLATVPAA